MIFNCYVFCIHKTIKQILSLDFTSYKTIHLFRSPILSAGLCFAVPISALIKCEVLSAKICHFCLSGTGISIYMNI